MTVEMGGRKVGREGAGERENGKGEGEGEDGGRKRRWGVMVVVVVYLQGGRIKGRESPPSNNLSSPIWLRRRLLPGSGRRL